MATLKVDYDDDPDRVVAKVNAVLCAAGTGVQFVDDGQEHDGFIIYKLKPAPSPWHGDEDDSHA